MSFCALFVYPHAHPHYLATLTRELCTRVFDNYDVFGLYCNNTHKFL